MRFHPLCLTILCLALFFASCSDDDSDFHPQTDTRIITLENVTTVSDFVESGNFHGDGSFGSLTNLILPGESLSFSFSAANKQYLAFATMYGASKDWFFSPQNPGLKLFDDKGKAIIGDVSTQIKLWDNGTKDNITGDPESKPIAQVENVDASKLMKLNLAFDDETSIFTLTITNTSGGTQNETPFSPGVWAISNYDETNLLNVEPFFQENKLTNPEITDIAQGGNIQKLLKKVTDNTSLRTNVAQVLFAVYEGDTNPIYELGKYDKGQGLKELSQFGETEKLATSLKAMDNVKAVYVTEKDLAPGDKRNITIELNEKYKMVAVAMYAASNDWFISLSEPVTSSITGDVSSKLSILDSGTGVSQFPGAGNNQAIFDGTPKAENLPVSVVDNSKYTGLKSASGYLKFTVSK